MDDDLHFNVTRRREGDAVVVVPEGEVDLATVPAVREELLAARDEASVVVVDLRAVTFLDSSGLRLLVEAQRAADEGGASLAVVRGPAALQRLLDLSGVAGRVRLVDDPAEAAGGGDRPG